MRIDKFLFILKLVSSQTRIGCKGSRQYFRRPSTLYRSPASALAQPCICRRQSTIRPPAGTEEASLGRRAPGPPHPFQRQAPPSVFSAREPSSQSQVGATGDSRDGGQVRC